MASSSVSLPITLREKMTQVGRARSTGPGRGAWETLEFPEFSSFVSGFRNFRSFRRRYLASQRPPAHPGRPRPPARLAAAGNADILEGRGSSGGGLDIATTDVEVSRDPCTPPGMGRRHGVLPCPAAPLVPHGPVTHRARRPLVGRFCKTDRFGFALWSLTKPAGLEKKAGRQKTIRAPFSRLP